MKRNNYKICRNDIFLAAGLALAAIILFVIFILVRGDKKADNVRITLNGQVYGTYSLDQDTRLDIDADTGTNTVLIKDGKVLMEDADCPDRYCVSKGEISRTGETIVCLPHRLVVEILSEADYDPKFDLIAE